MIVGEIEIDRERDDSNWINLLSISSDERVNGFILGKECRRRDKGRSRDPKIGGD